MKFSIITPTYKRSDSLTKAVNSVLAQTYPNWEMIIVNDSPEDTSYTEFEKNITDKRIRYFKNGQNAGVNYSRNFALDNLSTDSSFVIFLDDDDWLAKDALGHFANLIKEKPRENWFVANRALKDGGPLTFATKNNEHYAYAWNYLISKKFKGDATHYIKTNIVKNIRFSKSIRQGEEWLFFYQLGRRSKFYYRNHDSTITEGYNRMHGLNFRLRTKSEQFKTLIKIISEGARLRIVHRPSFLIYICLRFARLLFKP